jgi:hypothetical protein
MDARVFGEAAPSSTIGFVTLIYDRQLRVWRQFLITGISAH